MRTGTTECSEKALSGSRRISSWNEKGEGSLGGRAHRPHAGFEGETQRGQRFREGGLRIKKDRIRDLRRFTQGERVGRLWQLQEKKKWGRSSRGGLGSSAVRG